jgi:hypothetical protein
VNSEDSVISIYFCQIHSNYDDRKLCIRRTDLRYFIKTILYSPRQYILPIALDFLHKL